MFPLSSSPLSPLPPPSLHHFPLQMAAVRAGAIGLARGNRYLVFSTNTSKFTITIESKKIESSLIKLTEDIKNPILIIGKDWSDDGRNESGNESDGEISTMIDVESTTIQFLICFHSFFHCIHRTFAISPKLLVVLHVFLIFLMALERRKTVCTNRRKGRSREGGGRDIW